MVSSALRHFPPVLFQNGERVLWNPVHRKPLANRPEERVRLRYLDFLLLDLKWPRTRIAIESTLPSTAKGEKMRADLVCYSKEMEPTILIECKADSARLDESAALQIARYNRSLMAPHLCITNGLRDFWFEIIEGRPVHRADPDYLTESGPDVNSGRDEAGKMAQESRNREQIGYKSVQAEDNGYRNIEYWRMRGFVGANASHGLSDIMVSTLGRFWGESRQPSGTYLTFQIGFRDIPFDHYYRIFDVPGRGQLAVTFTATPTGETCLLAFLNIQKANRGFLVVSLDKLLSGDPENGVLVSKGATRPLDATAAFYPGLPGSSSPPDSDGSPDPPDSSSPPDPPDSDGSPDTPSPSDTPGSPAPSNLITDLIANLPRNLYDLFQEIL